MSFAAIILLLVTLQRLGELVLAQANTRRLMARGAIEVGAAHYPLIVALHAAWLLALWIYGYEQPVSMSWLAAFVVLQALRVWVLATLRSRWTTRIIVLPCEPLIATGPYRFIAHPNYAVVIGEIAVLPLVLHLPALALVFSALNAAVLIIRIRSEARALGERTIRATS